jgi:hypothetical protein
MKKIKQLLTAAAVLAALMISGSLLHIPQWVAKAAAIYSSPTSNIIEAYRQPYASSNGGQFCTTSSLFCTFNFASPPAGHRLVLQYMSVTGGATGTAVQITLGGGVEGSISYASPLLNGAINNARDIVYYYDSTDTPQIQVSNQGTGSTLSGVGVTLIGYLENCSAYPNGACPAIAQ